MPRWGGGDDDLWYKGELVGAQSQLAGAQSWPGEPWSWFIRHCLNMGPRQDEDGD